MTAFLRPRRPPPSRFTLAAGLNEGKPVVVVDFGKRFGRMVLDADDVDRFVAQLEAKLREARELGTT